MNPDNEIGKTYNILLNASNQANLTKTNNLSSVQINSIFLFVSPFYMEEFNIEDLDISIKVDEQGSLWINGQKYSSIEIKPGISIFGITKR